MPDKWGLRPVKRPRNDSEQPTAVPLSNRYEVLQNSDECDKNNINQDEKMDENQDVAEKVQEEKCNTISGKKKKVPPIIISHELDDYSGFVATLKSFIKGDPKLHYSPKSLAIYAENEEDYSTLINELDIAKCDYHTYPTKEMKTKRMVLKRLPNIPSKELEDDLDRQGVKCHKITILKTKTKGELPTDQPIYLIDFPHHTDLKKVEDIRYRCQRFGHGTTYCRSTPRCVKCDEDHLTATCKKTKEIPPKCIF
ncbi:uncharacterized protein LOC117179478 [Belonocnema kinseyi]|uniref:uncharacterized protein LOC117179478 n=1 Tax=Belonocnema kinseyi TaxID=2817044 RepID=UPI00143D39CA|nr:uncharacterized protein LOC117179478 [Belonocnema kinseyi]